MKAFPVIAIILVVFSFVFHMMFIMFDYAYYNGDTGVFNMMPSRLNETMSSEYQSQAWNQTVMLREAFGMGRFLVLGIGIVCGIISVVDYVSDRRVG